MHTNFKTHHCLQEVFGKCLACSISKTDEWIIIQLRLELYSPQNRKEPRYPSLPDPPLLPSSKYTVTVKILQSSGRDKIGGKTLALHLIDFSSIPDTAWSPSTQSDFPNTELGVTLQAPLGVVHTPPSTTKNSLQRIENVKLRSCHFILSSNHEVGISIIQE